MAVNAIGILALKSQLGGRGWSRFGEAPEPFGSDHRGFAKRSSPGHPAVNAIGLTTTLLRSVVKMSA